MKLKSFISLCTLLLLLSPLALAQSKETGAIVGTVADEEDSALPGATVTLTGPNIMGDRTAITDAQGRFRFPALPPGIYAVKAELPGFATIISKEIRVHTTVRLTVDLTMKLATLEEEITVIAVSPTVDVKTSETASVTLSDDILRNMPTSQFVTGIVNLAPGVDGDVAYGSSDGTGISYQVDGVDVGDPEGGSAWVFLDYNIIEEAKIMGIGLNAEYGAFTGVIFNTITKSGGNEFSGHAEFIYQATKIGFWTAENNQEYIEDFSDLASPVRGLMDTSFHLGGPIKKDKIWFFLGGQYYRSKNRPAGFEPDNPDIFRDYKQPRGFFKITAQASSKVNLMLWYEQDAYNGINRRASSTHPTETCVEQKSPESVGNFSLTYIFNPTTFFDIKGSFFVGYYYLEPMSGTRETTAWFSAEDNTWLDNSNWYYLADRSRYQANAGITHYAEDFIKGNHDFKFGTEFERGWARSRFGYTGYLEGIGSNVYIYDWYGTWYGYQYEGYDLDTHYTRSDWYAQDSWSVSDNLTLNFGFRYSMNRGYVKGVSGAVFKTNRFAPRVGFAYDILGDHTTVLKAHYGQFTESMFTGFCDILRPDAISEYIIWDYYGPGDAEIWRTYLDTYTLDSDVKHPYMDQFTVGIERELFKDASLGVSFIYRNWHNFMGTWEPGSEYDTITVDDEWTTDTYTGYDQTNYDPVRDLVRGNLKKDEANWLMDEPTRNYKGIEVLFNKRFSNRWQMLASYVYSQSKGTMGTGFGDDVWGPGRTYDPNWWTDRDGRSYSDPTHMFKFQGSYILPLDIHFNAYFRYITGNTYTRRMRPRFSQGRRYIFTEPRGSRRYPSKTTLDLRLEKTFMIAEKYRIGLMMDIFNVFNSDTITSWGSRVDYDWTPHEYDSTAPGPDGHEVYNLVEPRAIRLGVRFFF